MNYKKETVWGVTAIIVISLVIGLWILQMNNGTEEGAPCTLEAKICSDGSSVGREGPSCEFAPCPNE